uniref:Uncharacterized protein n=1 Tax=Oryza glaberrima TaxID=4538 RepID=I1Q316_ORYGL
MKGFEGLLIVDVRDAWLASTSSTAAHPSPLPIAKRRLPRGTLAISAENKKAREGREWGDGFGWGSTACPMAHRCHSLDSHGSASSHASIGSITLTLGLSSPPLFANVTRALPPCPIPIDHSFFPI